MPRQIPVIVCVGNAYLDPKSHHGLLMDVRPIERPDQFEPDPKVIGAVVRPLPHMDLPAVQDYVHSLQAMHLRVVISAEDSTLDLSQIPHVEVRPNARPAFHFLLQKHRQGLQLAS